MQVLPTSLMSFFLHAPAKTLFNPHVHFDPAAVGRVVQTHYKITITPDANPFRKIMSNCDFNSIVEDDLCCEECAFFSAF